LIRCQTPRDKKQHKIVFISLRQEEDKKNFFDETAETKVKETCEVRLQNFSKKKQHEPSNNNNMMNSVRSKIAQTQTITNLQAMFVCVCFIQTLKTFALLRMNRLSIIRHLMIFQHFLP
jgi:hypothetical protein